MANFYALLIGIDYYQPNPYFNSLRGAVRDIDKVAAYLDKSLNIPSEQITRLTSPIPDTNSNADVRAQEMLPTYQNIVKAFNTITETAQAQDLVYIHYSGHGGRVKTIYPELKLEGKGEFDEGLVPMDVGDRGRYLRDVEMTTLLKRMTDKGLILTVVFDSCHSGGATRADGAIRGSKDGQPDLRDRAKESLVAETDVLIANWKEVTQKSPKKNWLASNHQDYVFLGACRPTEFAYESAIEGKDRNGALTYYMIETLSTIGENLTYQALYDRIKGQIQSKFPNQLPMLFGQGDRQVFGSEIKPVQYSLTVIGVAKDKVTLDGGIAQGLSRGTRFALYPVGSDFSDKQKRLAVVEITDFLEASKSTAKILSLEESGVSPVVEKLEGLPAVMEAAPVALKHRVRLFVKEVGTEENQLSPDLTAKQLAALDKISQAMQGNGWLIQAQGNDEEAHYQVAVGREGEYEISQKTPIKNLNPALSIDNNDAPAEVVKRLVHLAKYQTALSLSNPFSDLKKAVEYELLDADKKTLPDPNNISLKSGDLLYVRLKNISSQPLTVAILDFEATWEISQIPIQGDEAAFYSLQPQQETLTRLRFKVPEGEYNGQVQETLKLFVTRGIANFQWLILPALDQELAKRGGQLNEELQQVAEIKRGTKGEKPQISPLNQLFSQLGADVDKPPLLTRAAYDPDPNAEWLTQSILLTVKR